MNSLCSSLYDVYCLTHWGWDKRATISQTTLSNAFSWMKIYKILFIVHLSQFPRVQLTIFLSLPTHICITRPQWVKFQLIVAWWHPVTSICQWNLVESLWRIDVKILMKILYFHKCRHFIQPSIEEVQNSLDINAARYNIIITSQ